MRGTVVERVSPFVTLSRAEWAALRDSTEMPLTEAELATLRGLNEEVSMEEVAEIYLPLSRLLNLYVAATQDLYRATDTFLHNPAAKVPYVIGIAGSVAVGKSTTARILQALLARWPDHPTVDLVTTDGFLYPNAELEARGLMSRKGFPESYDRRRLLRFVADVKSGRAETAAPLYSHLVYDVLDQSQIVRQPDIMILEGLNVLQSSRGGGRGAPTIFVSDFFDFSIYVDAREEDLEQWYVERFLRLRETAFRDEDSYFHNYASLTREEATATARRIWREINLVNLRANIRPTRERASLILTKDADHAVQQIRLRKI